MSCKPRFRPPNANAYTERFVRSIKDECLNRVMPFGERHPSPDNRGVRRALSAGAESPRTRQRSHRWWTRDQRSHADSPSPAIRRVCSIITIAWRNETRGSIRRLGSRMRHYGLTPVFDSGVALFTGSSTFFVRDAYFTCSVSMYLTSALIRSLTDAALPLAANTSPHTGMSGPPWPRTSGLRPSIS